MSHLKNIAIVGGAGQSGSPIVKSLLETGKFNVTAITRSESSSTFPSAVKVHKGRYDSEEFLEFALQGQEVLIIILGTTALKDLQTHMIMAAAAASVPWILPCEFGPDADSEELSKGVPFLVTKKYYRDQIEELGKSSWISFNCGLWFDFVRYLTILPIFE
jgi:dihydrodipicolinate reductase